MKNEKRTLEELDIIDDYLFNELMTDKDHRDEFIDIEMNAGRQETGAGQKYDLRKRSRIYQSLLDVNMLPSGKTYDELNNVLIIICTPYDLFGENRLKYTFEYTCLENPALRLNDGARRIFLNTRGQTGGSEELRGLLQYIECSREENASSEELKNLHSIVTAIKSAEERRKWYMWAFEREVIIREEGRKEGREEGREEGKEEGREEGKEEERERINQLNRKLIASSRTEDLIKSTENLEYQEELFREFGI